MLELKKVAVTGGVSSGKTMFCSFLKKLGAYVVSADKIVHQLFSYNNNLKKKVIALLGEEILVNDQIDRAVIAQKVFNDKTLLNLLEQVIHPEVLLKIDEEYQLAKRLKVDLFVAEIPLLFEVKYDRFFDVTVAVKADELLCIERFIQKTHKSEKEYLLRMSRQLTQDEKALKADFLILNDGSEMDLYNKAKKLFKQLTSSSSR